MADAGILQDEAIAAPGSLAGVNNLRDLGGYPAADGRRVRTGLLYRSAALDKIPDDASEYLALKLRTIVDFRSEKEREAAPFRQPEGCDASIELISIVAAGGPSLRALLDSGKATPAAYQDLMAENYRYFVRLHHEAFASLFRLLLDEASYPLLFHCSAGKDRTGMAAALILTALGVNRQTIDRDYLLTNELWRGGSPFTRTAPPELLPTILRAEQRYLDSAFDTMAAEYGSAEGFLEARVGIGPAERERLRRLLLE